MIEYRHNAVRDEAFDVTIGERNNTSPAPDGSYKAITVTMQSHPKADENFGIPMDITAVTMTIRQFAKLQAAVGDYPVAP